MKVKFGYDVKEIIYIFCSLHWTTFVMDVSIRHPSGFLIEGSGQVCLLERCLVLLRQPFQSVLMRVPLIIPSSGPWPKHLRYLLKTLCIKYMAYTVIEHYLNCGTYSNSYVEYHPLSLVLTMVAQIHWRRGLIFLNLFVTITVRCSNFVQTK